MAAPNYEQAEREMQRLREIVGQLREGLEAQGIYRSEKDGRVLERPKLTLIRGGGVSQAPGVAPGTHSTI